MSERNEEIYKFLSANKERVKGIVRDPDRFVQLTDSAEEKRNKKEKLTPDETIALLVLQVRPGIKKAAPVESVQKPSAPPLEQKSTRIIRKEFSSPDEGNDFESVLEEAEKDKDLRVIQNKIRSALKHGDDTVQSLKYDYENALEARIDDRRLKRSSAERIQRALNSMIARSSKSNLIEMKSAG